MLKFKTFNDPKAFYNFFYGLNLQWVYPLIDEVLNHSLWTEIYSNPSLAQWTVVESDNYNDFVGIFCLLPQGSTDFKIRNSIHLSEFEVNELYRGQGLGTQILNQLITKNKYKNITLYSSKENSSFYQFLGFKQITNNNFYLRLADWS